MATIGRKTVSFENLEKPISDYCGGTGTMANFFKMLSKCKQDIIEQTGTDYSDETVLSLTDFISCVQSGVLCGRSDSFCFICKHYELNSSALAELWRRERGVEKSPCTFRCQIHNLSSKLFKLFGSDVFDTFYSQDSERLHQLRVKVQALSLKDVRFEDVFFFEMSNAYIGYGKIPSSDYRVEDCLDELKLLRQLKKERFKQALAGKDIDKLLYIRSAMSRPLVDADTMEVNPEKYAILVALGVIS